MYPKTALKILLIVFIVAILVFVSLYIKGRSDLKKAAEETDEIENIIGKKKQQQDLLAEEQQKLDAFVGQKVEEKRRGLDQKTEEEIKKEGYTQDEVDFILNPEGIVKKELGIGEKKETKQMTQEEIDAILNPRK